MMIVMPSVAERKQRQQEIIAAPVLLRIALVTVGVPDGIYGPNDVVEKSGSEASKDPQS